MAQSRTRQAPRAWRRESRGARVARAAQILELLERAYPDAQCALVHHDPLELLVATILSAQCTDVRVNLVTPALFARCPTAADYAAIPTAEIEELIRSTGFFRNKARALRGLGMALVERHDGRVPATMEELIALPGVGRKTANVVLGNAFGRDQGIVVDTHVGRLAERLGLSRATAPVGDSARTPVRSPARNPARNPIRIERDLMQLFPRSAWTPLAHLLIAHGRTVCRAQKPRCGDCPLAPLCPAAEC